MPERRLTRHGRSPLRRRSGGGGPALRRPKTHVVTANLRSRGRGEPRWGRVRALSRAVIGRVERELDAEGRAAFVALLEPPLNLLHELRNDGQSERPAAALRRGEADAVVADDE